MCPQSMADGNCGPLTRTRARPSVLRHLTDCGPFFGSSLAEFDRKGLAPVRSGNLKKNRLQIVNASSIPSRLRPRPAHRLAWTFDSRQIGKEHREAGAAEAGAHAAVHVNASPILLHDAVADPQAQPGPFFTFGGEEGIKNTAPVLFANAVPIIRDGNAYSLLPGVAPIARLEHMHFDGSAFGDRVQGIAHQVGEHLPDLAR